MRPLSLSAWVAEWRCGFYIITRRSSQLDSNIAREKWGLELRPGGWVEFEKDLRGNTQDMTTADVECGFPLGADDVVFLSTSKYWQMCFVPKGRSHPLKTEPSFLVSSGSASQRPLLCAVFIRPQGTRGL